MLQMEPSMRVCPHQALQHGKGSVRPASARILIVDDDEVTLDSYAHTLRLEGYEVRTALSAEAAWRDVDANPPDAIVADLRLPMLDGLGFLGRLRARGDDLRHTPVAIVTGDLSLDDATAVQLLTLGAQTHFKPLWLEHLTDVVQSLLQSRQRD